MTTIEMIHEEILEMKKDIKEIKASIDEEYEWELIEEVIEAVEKARKTPLSEYIEL